MPIHVVVADYGMGNLHSVKKALTRLQINPLISSSPDQLLRADKIILPGVGHFQMAMENLQKRHLDQALHEAVIGKGVPVLGICLGMQLLANSSEEGGMVKGLGWIDAEVVRFRNENTRFKIPHMGWNSIKVTKSSPLMQQIPDGSEFYFVHSYHFRCQDPQDMLNETDYVYPFASAVQKGHIMGAQYHPEKSHDTGLQLLKNFIEL